MDNAGFVIMGYLVTAATLGIYVLRLWARSRDATRRATQAREPR